MSVCHGKLQIDSSFSFLDGIDPFWPSVLHVALYKTLFFDFWFRPPYPKFNPKICTKIAYNSTCMTDKPQMFAPTRGFWVWLIQFHGTMQNVVGRPLLLWQRNFGYARSLIAYRLVITNQFMSVIMDLVNILETSKKRVTFTFVIHVSFTYFFFHKNAF